MGQGTPGTPLRPTDRDLGAGRQAESSGHDSSSHGAQRRHTDLLSGRHRSTSDTRRGIIPAFTESTSQQHEPSPAPQPLGKRSGTQGTRAGLAARGTASLTEQLHREAESSRETSASTSLNSYGHTTQARSHAAAALLTKRGGHDTPHSTDPPLLPPRMLSRNFLPQLQQQRSRFL